ncbi:hypothetical protein [Corallococcus sp. CA054B]|uniref:hypothetical protein n=1 Tax=Corallococcus sp. CA054B TaxID=2316734 RepID=UPI0011C43AD5|nr:hypothetical protein [Corallococcus sp. CA054B]
MLKDRAQKEALYRHFRSQGWMAQLEVPVVPDGAVSRHAAPVTDIDVLGIRPSSELRWRYVIGDCKTRKKESPVNRVLWASGLMDAFGATTGVVLLKREPNSRIERDHKLFADERRILLLEEDEFSDYDKAIVYPSGSNSFPESTELIEELRDKTAEKFPQLREYLRWVFSDAWATTDHAMLLRMTLGKARDIRGEIDPRRTDHLALALEGASSFAVPFATLVGTIFRRHIKPTERTDLDEAARMIIWGGREQYDFYNRMRSELAQAKGSKTQAPLGLPEWDRFLELLRTMLEAPHYAFQCPQALRCASLHVLSGNEKILNTISDKTLLHLAMKIAAYFTRAVGYPLDTSTHLSSVFKKRIDEVINKTPLRTPEESKETIISRLTPINGLTPVEHEAKAESAQLTLPAVGHRDDR